MSTTVRFKDISRTESCRNQATPHSVKPDVKKAASRPRESIHPNALLRLPQVLELVPVGGSTWWAGVKSGRFPRGSKLGPRTTVWLAKDIFKLIDEASGEH